jgi:general stress protein 26
MAAGSRKTRSLRNIKKYDYKKQVLEWLQDHPLASIATVTTDGQLTMAAVYTYADEKFGCYFKTKVVARK